MSPEATSALDPDMVLAIAAVITALAGLVKVWWDGKTAAKNLKALEEKVSTQDSRIALLERENAELKRENAELRDQNQQLMAINEEYRGRVLASLEHKTTPRK